MEAHEALSQKDAVTYRQKLAERAELIADLPARVRETVVKGQSFPEEELYQLEIFSELADKSLKKGGNYALNALLIPNLVGEPNLLEELVSKLYPQSGA